MDSLQLGLQNLYFPETVPGKASRHRYERSQARQWQAEVLGWMRGRGLTHSDLARALGVDPSTVTSVLNARAQLPSAWYPEFAACLGVSVAELQRAWRRWPVRRQRRGVVPTSDLNKAASLRLWMRTNGVSLSVLAKHLGTNKNKVSRVTRGLTPMPPHWPDILSAVYGEEVAFLNA